VFVVLGFVFSAMRLETKFDSHRMLKYIIWGVIIGGVITAGFFLPNMKLAGVMKY
jgi:FtsH-binding integral membrane protein